MSAPTSTAWKPIPGYDGQYEVSDQGEVRSAYGVLAQRVTRRGRREVHLSRGGKRQHHYVHRLVLEAFVGPCPDGMECCHADDDPTNNRLSNLRWDTRSANQIDRVRNGFNHNASKPACPRGHALAAPNLRSSSRGRRACLACERAYDYMRRPTAKSKPDIDLAGLADRYYADIMAADQDGGA